MSKLSLWLALCVGSLLQLSVEAQPAFRSIFRGSNGGTDLDNYFEIVWTPNTSLSNYTFIVINGTATGTCGAIAQTISLSGRQTGSNGIFLYRGQSIPNTTPDPATSVFSPGNFTIPNSGRTYALVENYVAPTTPANDIDNDNNGVIDNAYGGTTRDAISMSIGTSCAFAGQLGGTTFANAGYTPDLLFFEGGSWFAANTDIGAGGSIILTAGEVDNTAGVNQPQFYGATIAPGSTASALPIELLSFTGKQVDNTIVLRWETATEQNNAYMAVERSRDGIRFNEIGQRKGAGTSYEIQRYHFTDPAPFVGINYYRLRQVDMDGTATYHPVETVRFEGKSAGSAQLFPTLAHQEVTLVLAQSAREQGVLRIVNSAGQVVRQQPLPLDATLEVVPVKDLTAGSYFLIVQNGHWTETLRFVKY